METFVVNLTVRFEADNGDAALDALIEHVNQIAYVSGCDLEIRP